MHLTCTVHLYKGHLTCNARFNRYQAWNLDTANNADDADIDICMSDQNAIAIISISQEATASLSSPSSGLQHFDSDFVPTFAKPLRHHESTSSGSPPEVSCIAVSPKRLRRVTFGSSEFLEAEGALHGFHDNRHTICHDNHDLLSLAALTIS